MAKDKNKDIPENKIKEGTDEYAINKETKDTDRKSYPKLKEQDQQQKDQSEFIDNKPDWEENK